MAVVDPYVDQMEQLSAYYRAYAVWAESLARVVEITGMQIEAVVEFMPPPPLPEGVEVVK